MDRQPMLPETNAAQPSRSDVIAALRQASAQTGSDFNYLLGTAMRESSLQPSAKSSSSSAAGLFQFVQQTWLGMVKQYGAKFGLGSYANAIEKGGDGHYSVDNATDRDAILALRQDPKISSLMAGQYAQDTRAELQARLGRSVCSGELYAAHFLGPASACHLIELSQTSPNASAVQCFPAAADANRNVFYHHDGSAKSVREVYDWAVKQPESKAAALPAARAPIAAAPPSVACQVHGNPSLTASLLAQLQSTGDLSSLGLFRDSATAAQTSGLPATLPQPAFMLTPGVMTVLSELDPKAMPSPAKPHRPG